MHVSSRVKFEAFAETYLDRGDIIANQRTILDIGSRGVQGSKAYNYRKTTNPLGLVYTGIDFEEGPNVNLVPKNPYVWEELDKESFDYVISGQAFEHNPFPWVTFSEVARVLKVGGIAFIIAPSAGPVHLWPYDCWRYYPDSWAGLCRLTGLEATEIFREDPAAANLIPGGDWMDSAVIATKPGFAKAADKTAFYKNLREIVAPFKARRYNVEPATVNAGPAYRAYLQRVKQYKTEPGAAKAGQAVDPRVLRRKRARRSQR